MELEQTTVSVPEAAKLLGVHRTTVLRLIHSGDFPTSFFKVGDRYRIHLTPLREHIKGNLTSIQG